MNIVEAVQSVLGKYATFYGRASRSEFWWWWVANSIVFYITLILSGTEGSFLPIIFWLATLLPTLAVTIRRHHDGNRSGWFVLIGFIPIVGGLILLYLYSSKGTVGPNIYGEDPLANLHENSDY